MEVSIEKSNIQPGDKVALINYLRSLETVWDAEISHSYADNALLQFIGDKEIECAYNSFEKWYA